MSQLPSVFELMVTTNHGVHKKQDSHNGLKRAHHHPQILQPMQQQINHSTTPQPHPLHFCPSYPRLTPHYIDPSRPYSRAPLCPAPSMMCHNTQYVAQSWHSDPRITFERSLRTDGGPLSSPSSSYTEPQASLPHDATTNNHQYHYVSSYPQAMRHSSIAPSLVSHIEDQSQQFWCPPVYHVQMLVHPQQLQHIPAGENPTLLNKRLNRKQRSRTGCITCRKRHLKCDETKPRCYNCARSHKVCLGYETSPRKPARPKLDRVDVRVFDDGLKINHTDTALTPSQTTLANGSLPHAHQIQTKGVGFQSVHRGQDQVSSHRLSESHWCSSA